LRKHTSIADDIAITLKQLTNGVGAIEYDTKLPPEDFAAFHTAVQRFLIERTRLGIPALFDGEACRGFVGTNATVFPVPLTLASTWDPVLLVMGGNEKTCHESWFPDHFGDRNDLGLLG